MAPNFCANCGTPLSTEDKFCSNCGQPLDAAPTTTTQTATPPLTPSSRLGAAFWLGLIGALLGFLLGLLILAFSIDYQGVAWLRVAAGILVIIFSILGIVGPLRIIDRGDTINALLMVIAGVGVLVSSYLAGILSALLFFIGAALLYLKKG